MTVYTGFPEPAVATVLYLVLGVPGLYLALRWMHEDASAWRAANPTQARIVAGLLFALVIAAVPILAAPILDPCSETALRTVWGDWWSTGWWVMGCYLMP